MCRSPAGLRTSTFLFWLPESCARTGNATVTASASVRLRNITILLENVAENSDLRVLAVGAHVNEREARSLALRLYSDNVLVLVGADFQFDLVAARSPAGQFMRIVVPALRVLIPIKMAGVAL